VNTKAVRCLLPRIRSLVSAHLCRLHGIPERHLGRSVREGIVSHVLSIFISSDHTADREGPVRILLGTAHKEVSHTFEQFPAFIPEPGDILCYPVVIPGGYSHIRTHMVFKRACQSPDRRRFLSVRIRFPREHESGISIVTGLASCRVNPVCPVIDHGPGYTLIHEKHRRVHPYFSVPEYVSVVAKRRESHRRDAAAGSFTA